MSDNPQDTTGFLESEAEAARDNTPTDYSDIRGK